MLNKFAVFRKKARIDAAGNLDADDLVEDESEDSSDDEEEDDTAELMAELQKIKAERAAELAKKVNVMNMVSTGCYLTILYFNQGNGAKTRRRKNKNGKYIKWKPSVELLF